MNVHVGGSIKGRVTKGDGIEECTRGWTHDVKEDLILTRIR